LIQVELEPHGGNDWHYHKKFNEYFTVLKGKALVGKNGKEYTINEGDSGTYLPGIPGFIQEPLVNSLAKIAKWKGEDKDLEKYYH
jgi:mannose-6-phosphate isomerase-like protein (cupin superfamily)